MNKKSIYDFFIGLLALMLALMLVIDILIPIPKEVKISFYYTENIVRLIFIGDFIGRFFLSSNKSKFTVVNVIDLLSTIPLRVYLKVMVFSGLTSFINDIIVINGVKLFILFIYIIKFKIKTKDEIRKNRVYYLMILSTVIIVIGAVIISLIEGISLGDALWWSFVTFTTVGYGDILLRTQLGKIVAVILMFFGVGFIGVTTTALALYILNGGKRKKTITYKGQIIEGIKAMLDNYDDLTEEDIESIIKLMRSLKKNN